ncbi:pre-toxin TG domain-containing protein, partial [Bacillus suaedaesalsae]
PPPPPPTFEEILAMRTGNYNKLAGYMSNHFGGYSSKSLNKNYIFGSSGSSYGFDVKSSFGFGKFKFKKAKMPSTNFMKQAGSMGLDMIPVVGNIKSGLEAIMGRDLVTGQKLSTADRIIAAAGIFTGGAGKAALKGAKAGLGFAQGAKLTKGTDNVPHGNSKNSTKPQHGYKISEKETGDVAKTGISGQPLNKNGTSPRANSQVNKWNKEVGYEKYEADVVKPNIPNRQEALDWERENAQRLWEEGNSMNKHQRPKPWEE